MAWDTLKKQFLVALAFTGCLLMACVISVRAEQVQLRDGRVIEADEVWESGVLLWYRRGNVTASIPREEVEKITRTNSQSATPPRSTAHPGSGLREASVANSSNQVKITRILLKDGVQIEADEVVESDAHVRYRLGSLQTVIEREAIVEIIRDEVIEESEETAPVTEEMRTAPFSTGNRRLDYLIHQKAAHHQIDPLLIYLVMREESGFNHRAVSRVGARGLMQLMPATARRLGVRNIHDPVQNVEAGARYLRGLIRLYAGNVNLALAAYNAGEGAVARYGGRIPPYRETINYVRRISAAWWKFKRPTVP
jgi:hypothetical protein